MVHFSDFSVFAEIIKKILNKRKRLLKNIKIQLKISKQINSKGKEINLQFSNALESHGVLCF